MKHLMGLLGYPLTHSFSKSYFTHFFNSNHLPYEYQEFEYASVQEFIKYLDSLNHLVGFNITRPHKEAIIPYLHGLSPEAQNIQAVNCVKISEDGSMKGYNTDISGFEILITPFLKTIRQCLVFGTGGASKAVAFVLKKYQIPFLVVSRTPLASQISYADLSDLNFEEYNTFINTTPVGQYPNSNEVLPVPFDNLPKNSIAIDLIYNPEETLFLHHAKIQGATVVNGKNMLIKQAEKSFEIWRSSL